MMFQGLVRETDMWEGMGGRSHDMSREGEVPGVVTLLKLSLSGALSVVIGQLDI